MEMETVLMQQQLYTVKNRETNIKELSEIETELIKITSKMNIEQKVKLIAFAYSTIYEKNE